MAPTVMILPSASDHAIALRRNMCISPSFWHFTSNEGGRAKPTWVSEGALAADATARRGPEWKPVSYGKPRILAVMLVYESTELHGFVLYR